jgi:hypothetical protein
LHTALFKAQSGPAGLEDAMAGKGRATKIEHEAMVRGLMIGQEHRFLEWSIDEGWTPLCKFLGKDVPDVDFPRMNTTKEISGTAMEIFKAALRRIAFKLVVLVVSGAIAAIAWRKNSL